MNQLGNINYNDYYDQLCRSNNIISQQLSFDYNQNLDGLQEILNQDDYTLFQVINSMKQNTNNKYIHESKHNNESTNQMNSQQDTQPSTNENGYMEISQGEQYTSNNKFSNATQTPQMEQSIFYANDSQNSIKQLDDSFQGMVIDLQEQSESDNQIMELNNNICQFSENVHHEQNIKHDNNFLSQLNIQEYQVIQQQNNQQYSDQSNQQYLDQQSMEIPKKPLIKQNSQLHSQQQQIQCRSDNNINKKQKNKKQTKKASPKIRNTNRKVKPQNKKNINKIQQVPKITKKKIQKKNDNTSLQNPKNESFAVGREKERTVKQVIFYLKRWKFYSKKENKYSIEDPFSDEQMEEILGEENYKKIKDQQQKYINGELIDHKQRHKPEKQYIDFIQSVVGLPAKTLQDYQTQIKKGWQIGYCFKEAIEQGKKIGELRQIIKQIEYQNIEIDPKYKQLKTDKICDKILEFF